MTNVNSYNDNGEIMESVEEIRKRLNNENGVVKEKKIIKFFNFFLVLCSLALGALIYCKYDENGTFFKNVFNVDVSFKELNSNINNALNNLFKIENEEEILVSMIDIYHDLGNNNFSTDDKTIRMLDDGEVVVCSYQYEYKYFVVVSYQNGVTALYTLIDEINIENSQKLGKNDVIGTYNNEYFNCVFKKDDKIINYHEAIK